MFSLFSPHFFFFFFPSLHPPSPLPYYSLQVQPVVSRGSLANVPCGGSREEDSGRSHSTKKGAFHEIFNLPESERPLPGKSKYYSFLFISFGTHFYFCTSNLKMSKSWNHVFSVNNAPSSSCMLFVHSLWKWLEVLPDKPRQEDAHRLHQERDALRHGEVSGTSLSQGRALSHQISERRREAALPFTGGADERNEDSLVQRRRSFKLRWASSLLLSV